MNNYNNLKKTFNGKKVFITGNTGFKGSWLSIILLELGAKVYGYALKPLTENDNFITTELASKVNQIYADIRNIKILRETIIEINPDFVFHLAAQPLVLESYINPSETFEINMMGTVNLFECIKECNNIKVAINVTSDKCYENKEWIWGYRENDPMGGRDPYSASKGCSELITNSYINSFFQADSTCLIGSARAGNVIGGGDWADNRIVPDFFRSFKNKKTLTIRNPNSTRPWQHVLEPLFGYLTLASKLLEEGKSLQGGWNFGPKVNTHKTVENLIDTLKKDIRINNVQIEYVPPNFHEANFLKLDITKAITQLDWRPILNFEQTIAFTIQGYLDEINDKGNVYGCRVKQIEAYKKLF